MPRPGAGAATVTRLSARPAARPRWIGLATRREYARAVSFGRRLRSVGWRRPHDTAIVRTLAHGL